MGVSVLPSKTQWNGFSKVTNQKSVPFLDKREGNIPTNLGRGFIVIVLPHQHLLYLEPRENK
jgi:hypothetical protein